MFKLIESDASRQRCICEIFVDGKPSRAMVGEPLAAALLKANCVPMRHTPVNGAPRAPFCMMGVCFECLVEVDGTPNVQACATPVREGMHVRLIHGARSIGQSGEAGQ